MKQRGKGLMLFGAKPAEPECKLAIELRKLAEAMPNDRSLVHTTSELFRTIHALGNLRKIETTFAYKNALRAYQRVTGDAFLEPLAE